MDSTVSRTGNVSAWARAIPAFLLTLGCLVGEAAAQGPLPAYEKKVSWEETLVSLRVQTASQPELFLSRPVFRLGNTDRCRTPAHPLVAPVRPASAVKVVDRAGRGVPA